MKTTKTFTKTIAELLEEIKQQERDFCKTDVCGYCAGHYPQYDKVAVGPNEAHNWIHRAPKDLPPDALCKASGVFSRELYLKGQKTFDT